MKDSVLISIVIVGYNTSRHLSACLESIYNQTYRNFEIIFVNNGSKDSTSLIVKSYPDIRLIENDENKGFCFANNQGIKIARGQFIFTLNSDIVLNNGFLSEMMESCVSDRIGLLGGKILYNDRKHIDSTGLMLSRFYRFFDRGNGRIDSGQYDKDIDIFGPCAAAAVYKKEMLEDIRDNGEYFDEDFFFLGEDFDIAWRARNKGWKAKFVPRAVCYHLRNSTNFNSKFRQYLSFRNRWFMLLKNKGIGLRYILVFFFYDVPRLLYMLVTNQYTLKALYEIVRYAPKTLRNFRKGEMLQWTEIYRRHLGIKDCSDETGAGPHILNIVQRYYPSIGGAEMYMKEISERLVKDGYKVTVFTTDAWDLEHFWKAGKLRIKNCREICNGVNIERFRAIKFPFHNIVMRLCYNLPFLFSKSLFSLPSPVVFGMWNRLFFKNHHSFDAVHVSAFPYNSLIYMGIRYAKKHKLPLIVTPFLHLGEYKNDKVNRYYTRGFQMKLLNRCDKVIVQTTIERDYLRSVGIDDRKISIIGQGVNVEDIQGGDKDRFRKKFKITEKKIVFHVSTKSYDKGTFHLVEAMKDIWRKDKEVKLVLAGPPMDEFNRYFSNETTFVKEKTLVLDYVMGDDKRDLFVAGDVFVLPSRTDSYGAVFLEAWVNKKPVIGAKAGGVSEVIKDKEDGFLVKFGDTREISRSIETLLHNEQLANKMGTNGLLKVQSGLSWEDRYSNLRQVFKI